MSPMTAAFKTVAVVGKSDAASIPALELLSATLRRRGVRILMDPRTAAGAKTVSYTHLTLPTILRV